MEESSPTRPLGTLHTFEYGERVRFSTKLKKPRNSRNPGAFNYRGYLADRGIAALGSAKGKNVELLSGFTGTRVGLWRGRLHRGVVRKRTNSGPRDKPS